MAKYFYIAVNFLFARLSSKPLILCFHRIKDSSASLLDRRVGCTSPPIFEKVLNHMIKIGYEFVSLERLVELIDKSNFKRMAAVTFDDGFKDLYSDAFPMLKRLNIPFSLFLTTFLIESDNLLWLHKLYIALDKLPLEVKRKMLQEYTGFKSIPDDITLFIGECIHKNDKKWVKGLLTVVSNQADIKAEDEKRLAKELYLSKDELEEMMQDGLKIEVHGHEHWPLQNLDENETKHEIQASIRFIEEKFGCSPRYFALPSGKSNKFTEDVARSLGLQAVVTIERKILTGPTIDPFNLPRVVITDDLFDFYRVLAKNYLKYVYTKLFRVNKTEKKRY